MAEPLPPRPVTGWRFWAFLGFMLALLALFVALGTWLVVRLGEKERLIAVVAARAGLPPEPLPPPSAWRDTGISALDFRAVTATGHFLADRTLLVFTSLSEPRGAASGPGYWVMTPFALADGGSVWVNRGFVPDARRADFAAGEGATLDSQSITGVLRQPEQSSAFTPAPDIARRVEWVRDPARLSAMAGDIADPLAPFYLDLPSAGPGVLPQGGETVMEFPNNHLGYAATWYGFALLVPFLLWVWVRRQRRPAAQKLAVPPQFH